jgi:hypothetical protein
MPIRRLLDNSAFGPDEITVMIGAFEDTLRALKPIDRNDPVTLLVAKKIIELARQGERNPVRLRDEAIKSVSK